MIVFVHIERSGGAKISQTLYPYFGERAVIFTGQVDVPQALERVVGSGHRNWYLGGHVRFPQLGPILETRRPGDVLLSTTRDPLERAVSLYYLCHRSPTWLPTLAPIAQERGFAAFYAAAVTAGMLGDNQQCRFLSGAADWRQALTTLQAHYDLVGTHRYYGAFLRRLQTFLQPQVPDLCIDDTRINAAYHDDSDGRWQQREAIDRLVDPATRRRIERDHDQDYALIEYIESLEEGVFVNAPPAQGARIA